MSAIGRWWAGLNPEKFAITILLGLSLVFLLGVTIPGLLDIPGVLHNLASEMLGAVITFVLIQEFVGGREKLHDLKTNLIHQLGSADNALALQALKELRARGWLADESLKVVDLTRANLQGALLSDAYLPGASLLYADLRDAYLLHADLGGAMLNTSTRLPDGSHWTPDVDLRRFTEPDYPDFWKPAWA
jgi:hypothetical protein